MVWYSHLFQIFPQFIVIHTVKGFGIVKKAKIDVFLELSCRMGQKKQGVLFQRKEPHRGSWVGMESYILASK